MNRGVMAASMLPPQLVYAPVDDRETPARLTPTTVAPSAGRRW